MEIRVIVHGVSMYPFLKAGDVVFVKPEPFHKLKSGDIIVFEKDSGLIAHRLLKTMPGEDSNMRFLCKGDAARQPDPLIMPEEYKGKVYKFSRNHKEYYLNTSLNKGIGWMMVTFRPRIYLLLYYKNKFQRLWKRGIRQFKG